MRIQHNIMAMNAYRNYNNNTSALSKNLEKLSSGYKINRAGDDAAGLAISEKMRAQITGLETAQKNAKDGISLVQTAEGALTEVHDMLNRMVELANQSANGTYDNQTDRDNLQKEMDQLRSEIDRIADSSNFNGINLLDGSMDASGTVGGEALKVSFGNVTAKTDAVTAQAPSFEANLDGLSVKLGATKATGTVTVNVGAMAFTLTAKGASGATVNAAAMSMASATKTYGGLQYTVAYAGGKLTFTAKSATNDKLTAATDLNPSLAVTVGAANSATVEGKVVNTGTQVIQTGRAPKDGQNATANFTLTADMFKDGTTIKIGDKTATVDYSKKGATATGTTIGVKDLLDANGNFDATKLNEAASRLTKAMAGNTVFSVGNQGGSTITLQSLSTVASTVDLSTVDAVKAQISVNSKTESGNALVLQIGDTSDSFNQLEVSIQDMHVSSLGIDSISIATQADAKAAVNAIKNAINTVSSVRGTLGATQNRLDHTINNLSVMTENIQDAESTIRDTDIADEMMAYTKNNILVQSAQAMLAQANQVPQGVLQLLQ